MTKTAEKIIASKLVYLANTTNIVNSDQMSSRKQISAINAVMSLVHDIELVVSSETIKENCLMLENAAEKLLQLQNQNNIQFDMKKIELIHFHTKKSIENSNFPVIIRNNQMQSKNLIR